MLELARGVAQRAHGFKCGVLFLFNTGEEEGLDGAHSFITQVSLKLHTDAICPCSVFQILSYCLLRSSYHVDNL
jgi:putative aminopeptidase FrvX